MPPIPDMVEFSVTLRVPVKSHAPFVYDDPVNPLADVTVPPLSVSGPSLLNLLVPKFVSVPPA